MSLTVKNKTVAIITGASSGLGREFALQIEKKFFLDEIWLIARRPEPMKELSEKFQKSKGVILCFDLGNRSDLSAIQKKLSEENPDIVFLVNNAGYGKIGPFSTLGLDEQMQMVDLNVRALTFLSKIVIPYMKPGAKLIQVASSIAYCPAPYFAVYAATKSFVLSLSQALNYELRDQGIHVMAVCPGPVSTEFFAVAQNNEAMKDKVGDAEPFNKSLTANAKDVVEKALHDLSRDRRESIFSFPIKMFARAVGFVPKSIALRMMAKGRKRQSIGH